MNSVFSQAAEAECLERNTCLDGERSGTSNGTRTAKKSSRRGFATAFCTMRRSSGTFENLSAADARLSLREWLTLSVRDSHASRSASPESNAVPTTSATCGPQRSSAFAWYDRDSASWKTCQGSLLPDTSQPSLVILPRAGMTRDGVCFPQPKWERRINETGCGLWPTPNVGGGGNPPSLLERKGNHFVRRSGKKAHLSLDQAVTMWPTPTVQDSANNAGPSQHHRNSNPLNVAVLYPTPTACEHTQNKSRGENAQLRLTLVGMARYDKWPTPKASPSGPDFARATRPGTGSDDLITEVVKRTYPTARATDGTKGGPNQRGSKGDATLPSAVQPTGKSTRPTLLNPAWVEWLMGWPIGWTGLEPLEMDRFHWWLRSHGVY